MDKDVLLTITGLHDTGEAGEPEPMVTQTRAQYFYRNGAHYCLYEEQLEEGGDSFRSRLRFHEDKLELVRPNMHMIFEEGKNHRTLYATPWGKLELEICTKKLRMLQKEDSIRVSVEYHLESEGQLLSDCRLAIEISPI